ncbi:TcaA 3rd/4th domain-containing protein [Lactovum odontotermitis]
MATKEDWLAAFEAREGRKPTMDEFTAAKAAGFQLPENAETTSQTAAAQESSKQQIKPSPRDLWLADFEKSFKRKPTAEEFVTAKARNFQPEESAAPEAKPEKMSELLTNSGRQDEQSSVGKAVTESKTKQLKESMLSSLSRKQRGIIFGSTGTALILIIIIIIASVIYSKDAQLGRLSEILNSKNEAKIVKVLKVDDKDFKLTAKSIKPYVSYLKANPDELDKMSSDISTGKTSQKDDVYVKKSGSHLLFWPNYVLDMNLIYPKISVKNTGTTVKFANVTYEKTASDNQSFKPEVMVPGEYELSANITMGGATSDVTRTLDMVRYDNSKFTQNLNIEFKFATVTIRSNSFPDADIYVDERKVGHLNNGIAKLPKMAFTDGMQIYLRKTFPSKTLESDHVDLTEGQPDITLDFKLYSGNISDYKTIIDNFQTQLYETYGGLTEDSNLAKYCESGASTKGYAEFVTQHFTKIKNHDGGIFSDYRYKYLHDAQISLVDISNNELVFNVNFTVQRYWKMANDPEIGYQTCHFVNRQIIIDASQARNLLADSENYNPSDGYIKIRDFGTWTLDKAVYDKNFNWSSLY